MGGLTDVGKTDQCGGGLGPLTIGRVLVWEFVSRLPAQEVGDAVNTEAAGIAAQEKRYHGEVLSILRDALNCAALGRVTAAAHLGNGYAQFQLESKVGQVIVPSSQLLNRDWIALPLHEAYRINVGSRAVTPSRGALFDQL
jgi:hypothetical protein